MVKNRETAKIYLFPSGEILASEDDVDILRIVAIIFPEKEKCDVDAS